MKSIHIVLIVFIFFFLLNPIYGQVSFHVGSDTDLFAEDVDIYISGDFYFEGDINTNMTRVIFNGNDDQYLYQPLQKNLEHLKVDKASGALYLTDSLRVSDSLSLGQGKIITSIDAPLLMSSTAVAVGGNTSSYVDGPLIKVFPVSASADSFIYPTGDGLDYRPLTMRFASVQNDSISVAVEQVNGSAQGLSSTYSGVDNVSSVHYWHIQKSAAGEFTEAQITLSYDSVYTDDGVAIGSELRIVQLDTVTSWVWNDIGGIGSADYKGTITSTTFSGFQSGYFSFGDASGGGDIALPVFLTFFDLSDERGQVALSWKTASEINNLYWLVQRKDVETDTVSQNMFETIAKLDGQGTISNETIYSLADNSVITGKEYAYRLVDVSASGKKHFHDLKSIIVGIPNKYQLFQNYPNPFNPATTVLYDLPYISDVKINIYNILGQKVTSMVNKQQPAGYYKLLWDGRNQFGASVASGMYILTIQAIGKKDGENKNFSKAKKMMLLK